MTECAGGCACSRNSENYTGQFPDIVAALPGLLQEGTQSVVLDCEAVGFERATGRILPFQARPLLMNKGTSA